MVKQRPRLKRIALTLSRAAQPLVTKPGANPTRGEEVMAFDEVGIVGINFGFAMDCSVGMSDLLRL